MSQFEDPKTRPLKVYAFDPTRGRQFGNHLTVQIKNEPKLRPGPVGDLLKVVDYDASNEIYYEPVDLNDPNLLMMGGLDPTEADPRFHQQMVYAVASKTIEHFEFALGRPMKWVFRGGSKDDPDRRKLHIFPHAMQMANAYYSRELEALCFGYFPASSTEAGTNLPGQTVFTCLSYDIVAHETTHALIDSLREFFLFPTNLDVLAFHEGFSDIVALFQHFSHKEALIETIKKTGGMIHRFDLKADVVASRRGAYIQSELNSENPLVGLAQQFGEALGTRKALRSALGTPPNSDDINRLFEPHSRGAILVAAVFDAFFTSYIRRSEKLMRIARAGGAVSPNGDLHPSLVEELAEIAAKTAQQFLTICIRAIDYCPPMDITFGDFLRAMITADYDLVREDKFGYRQALIDAFRSRGIKPENVTSFSEEALLWQKPPLSGGVRPRCWDLSFNVLKGTAEENEVVNSLRRRESENNALHLHGFAKNNSSLLTLINEMDDEELKIQAKNFHPIHRVGPDGQLEFSMIVEFVSQRKNVLIDENDPSVGTFTFRSGATVMFDQNGFVQYVISKSPSSERLKRQQRFLKEKQSFGFRETYLNNGSREVSDFKGIHQGY